MSLEVLSLLAKPVLSANLAAMNEYVKQAKADDAARLTMCIGMYLHQNTILWGRLQTLSFFQIPALGGWFYFSSTANFFWAAMAVLLALVISLVLTILIGCDMTWRQHWRQRIASLSGDWTDKPIIDGKPEYVVGGRAIMNGLCYTFISIHLALLVLACLKCYPH